jgi:hypothetical protein
MHKLNSLLLLLLISLSGFAQIRFEKGYFIRNDGSRMNCEIRNTDPRFSPKSFDYRLQPDGPVLTLPIDSAAEFGIEGYSCFVRAKVKIDRSSALLDDLSDSSQPIWSQETRFLRKLVAGKAELYSFEDQNLIRFFYALDDSAIQQLVYKEYIHDGYVAQNNFFRQQIWSRIRSSCSKESEVASMPYDIKALTRYFQSYNQCTTGEPVAKIRTKKERMFGITLRGGMDCASVEFYNSVSDMLLLFNTQYSALAAANLEFVFPFNRNKWSFLVSPEYTGFEGNSEEVINQGTNRTATLKLQTVLIPIGIKYKFYLKNDLRLFLDALYVPRFCLLNKSELSFTPTYSLEIINGSNIAAGAGVEWKRLEAEIRYYTDRDLMKSYQSWFSNYERINFTLGYKLF